MKKILVILLAIIALSLCACEKDNSSPNDMSNPGTNGSNITEGATNETATSDSVPPATSDSVPPTTDSDDPIHTHIFLDASCTEPKKCSCGETEGNALGHKFANATCTAPKKCSVCSATEGEALGHKFADATCTAPKKCSVCSAIEGEALGHKFTDATCTAPKKCTVCSATEGEALGHNYKYFYCTFCKKEQTEGDFVNLKDYIWEYGIESQQDSSPADPRYELALRILDFKEGTCLSMWGYSYTDPSIEDIHSVYDIPTNTKLIYNNSEYYFYSGQGERITYNEDQSSVTVTLLKETITFEKRGINELVVTSNNCTNWLLNKIPVGTVFKAHPRWSDNLS